MNRRAGSLLLLALLVAGCGSPEEPIVEPTTPDPRPPVGPALVFGGTVRDAATGEILSFASVRLDLAQALPCGRQGIGWASWDLDHDGLRFGPHEVPRPRSDDVAFFLHVRAPGYAPNASFIGPSQARGDIGNLTVLLHPEAAVNGTAPPGTLVALDAPPFPRVVSAGADGSFAFPHARAADAWLVAGTDVPYRTLVSPPSFLVVPRDEARGWTLEGSVKGPNGAPVQADLVAWNGSALVGVARSSSSGVFAMALAPEPADLRIEAHTADHALGGVLALSIRGPPALRETVLVKPLC